MIDKYPKFLPQWTKALEVLHGQRERHLLFWSKPLDYGDKDDIMELVKRDTGGTLDWMNLQSCFTGEAFFHQHAPTCTCNECSTMTFRSLDSIESIDKFYVYKVRLAKHLQTNHKDIWAKWEARF